jgi:hypothetical protein
MVAPRPLKYVPAEQFWQLESPETPLYVPATHTVQLLLPIVEYVLAVQSWHTAEPPAEYFPDAHRLQLPAAGAPEPVK